MMDIAFLYHDDGAKSPSAPVYVAQVPIGITSKDVLLRILGQQLGVPKYFGVNWDALDECLLDLSWIAADDVCLWHEDLPLASVPKEANAYLRVLQHVLGEPARKAVQISFPKSVRAAIDSIMSSTTHGGNR